MHRHQEKSEWKKWPCAGLVHFKIFVHIGLSTLTDKTLPSSSLSLSSLFLSLLDCSLYWLYKTTFLRIECIMFLHMGKLYFLLMTHLSWIKAYSFTLVTVPSLFQRNQIPWWMTYLFVAPFLAPACTIIPGSWLNLGTTENASL